MGSIRAMESNTTAKVRPLALFFYARERHPEKDTLNMLKDHMALCRLAGERRLLGFKKKEAFSFGPMHGTNFLLFHKNKLRQAIHMLLHTISNVLLKPRARRHTGN